VKAAPDAQRRLLDLQAIDTALNQLAHRRKSLPELAEIDTVSRELSALEDERVRAQVAVDDLDRDITRFERDIEQVRTRKDRDQARLNAGGALRDPAKTVTFTNPIALSCRLDDVALDLGESINLQRT